MIQTLLVCLALKRRGFAAWAVVSCRPAYPLCQAVPRSGQPCSRAGGEVGEGCAESSSGCARCVWEHLKLLLCSPSPRAVLQHKFAAFLCLGLKGQARFAKGFCLSSNHHFSTQISLAFLFSFLLHSHPCHCGAICFLGGEDLFQYTYTDKSARFTFIENSFMHRKFA